MGELADRRRIAELFERFGPVIHLRDADACGVPRAALLRAEQRSSVTRLAKAAFVRADVLDDAGPWEAFRLRSIGFGLCAGVDTHLTGWAAAVVLGLPVLGDPPRLPIGLRSGDPHRAPNRTVHGRVRWGYLPPQHRTVRDRVRTVGPTFAAVDVARHGTQADALVITDAALRLGVGRESMAAVTDRMLAYPGIGTARWAVHSADARAESALESVGRLAFLQSGRPAPVSNPWIRVGSRWYRADHYLPGSGVILEADGAIKYNSRADAALVVEREKRRERDLRAGNFEIVRYTFAEARFRPGDLLKRVDAAVERQAGRPLLADVRMADPSMEELRRSVTGRSEVIDFLRAAGS